MSVLQRFIGLVLKPAAELRARGNDLSELARSLEASGRSIGERLRDADDTPANREAVAHVVGIERWGTQRLRVALGEPLRMDEHHPYRPSTDAGLNELAAAMASTRARTVATVRELAAAGVKPSTKVRHNDLGDLSLRGWVAYLDQHAGRELLRVRPG